MNNITQLQFVKDATVRQREVRIYKKVDPAQNYTRNHVGILVMRSVELTQVRVFTFFHEGPTLDESLITRYTLDSFRENFTEVVTFTGLFGASGSLDGICREALGKVVPGYVLVEAQEPEVISRNQTKLTREIMEAMLAIERGVEL